MSETVRTPRPSLWRDAMLWLLGGIVAMVLGTNAVMLWVAVRTHPDLVRSDYYEASKGVDGEQATRLASAHLGWRVAPLAEGRDVVLLRIADVEGRPVTGLTGEARAYRPADASLDQALPLGEDATEPGLYRARFARPAPGLWRLTLDVRRDGARFVHELPLVAP